MKVAPVMRAMGAHPETWRQTLVHTGQHYDDLMSRIFFEDLGMPQPDIRLDVGSGSHAEQYARVLCGFEGVLKEQRPDWVIVVGDVNSTFACALSAAHAHVRVAHIEAGLRSFDRTMPEEINRILTDRLSDLLFTTEESGNRNLTNEGIVADRIRFVGNTMIDTLAALLPRTDDKRILRDMGLFTSRNGMNGAEDARQLPYTLVTLHRPQNVDERCALIELLGALDKLGEEISVLFPVHPRTRRRIEENHLSIHPEKVRLLEPLGYLDFLTLMRYASLVITDSGGIQEETTYLRVPCLTVRPNTERPITIELGTNRLISRDTAVVLEAARHALCSSSRRNNGTPPLWDGHAAERIVHYLEQA